MGSIVARVADPDRSGGYARVMRVVVAGKGALGAAVLRACLRSRHDAVAVVQDVRRRQWLGAWDPAAALARRHRLPIVRVGHRQDAAAEALRAVRPDLLVLADFGIVLGSEVLEIPAVGAINAHWSLLPLHRGPDPAGAALRAGDAETGLTFHEVTEEVDAGPILDQVAFAIEPRDNAARLYHRAARCAEERAEALLDRIAAEGLVGEPPRADAGSSHRRPRPAETRLDWHRPARELDVLVRAATRPAAWLVQRGARVAVSEAEPTGDRGPPGTVLALRPPKIAAARGALILRRAYRPRALPVPWPAPWDRLRVGDVLPGPGGYTGAGRER